jgi:cell division protein FtsQ
VKKTRKVRNKNRKKGQLRRRLVRSASLARAVALRIWPLFLLLAIVFAGRFWLTKTDRFAMENVLVNRCEQIDPKALLGYIDVRIGMNLFTLDLIQIHEKLIGHHWIKSATVTRRLPDTLVVTVEPYTPHALVNVGELYYVDETGFLFTEYESGRGEDLPTISGFAKSDFLNGTEKAKRNRERLRTAVDLIQAAKASEAVKAGEISEVRYDPLAGYTLVLQPGRTMVRVGAEKFEWKLRRLKTIRETLGDRYTALTQVDLVHPDQAVIKGLGKVDNG